MKYLAHFAREFSGQQVCTLPVEAKHAQEAQDLALILLRHHPEDIRAAFPALVVRGASKPIAPGHIHVQPQPKSNVNGCAELCVLPAPADTTSPEVSASSGFDLDDLRPYDAASLVASASLDGERMPAPLTVLLDALVFVAARDIGPQMDAEQRRRLMFDLASHARDVVIAKRVIA